MHDLSLDLQLD